MKTPIAILILILTFICGTAGERTDVARYVNPLIGTDFTGNTYPGAQVPFGMVQLSPDNGLSGWDRIAGYFYPDSTIAGFSHTHLSGTGAGDLYDISFMPVTLPWREEDSSLGIHSRFSHDSERAEAGYYRVTLADYGIGVELTATERCGLQRYTFPKAQSAVILNLHKAMNWDRTVDSRIEVVDSVTVEGYRFSDGWARNQKVYFRTRFSHPFDSVRVDTTALKDGGKACVAYFYFDTVEGEQLTVATALSGVDTEGARRNLEAEAVALDFDACRERARQTWNAELSRILVDSDDDDLLTVFYTALYHSMLAPTIYSDVDGRYYGPDGRIHRSDGWTNYSTFSLWDTFRALHPLLTCIQPERTADMVRSLLAFGRQNGRLPVWNMHGSETDMMIGYHAVPVIAGAWLKGLAGDVEAEEVLEACVATACLDSYRGIGWYRRLGYVPCDADGNWSLSRTLEYAFDDYCIARMAERMGRGDVADEFYGRSANYRHLFNPATSFLQPRDSMGRFLEGFSPDDYSDHICESNGWQYYWSVQHDVEGLIALTGGAERFEERLDSMFTYTPAAGGELPIFSTGMIGQYAHGNEPSHHVAYLYNAVGRPWKTQHYVSRILRELYRNAPDGLCGNDDCGQLSAWYVFSAMGFYPVNPVSGQYEIGSPLFGDVRLRLPGGREFRVVARNAGEGNVYVRSVRLNGKPLRQSYITHDQLTAGGTLELEMSTTPSPAWYGGGEIH